MATRADRPKRGPGTSEPILQDRLIRIKGPKGFAIGVDKHGARAVGRSNSHSSYVIFPFTRRLFPERRIHSFFPEYFSGFYETLAYQDHHC